MTSSMTPCAALPATAISAVAASCRTSAARSRTAVAPAASERMCSAKNSLTNQWRIHSTLVSRGTGASRNLGVKTSKGPAAPPPPGWKGQTISNTAFVWVMFWIVTFRSNSFTKLWGSSGGHVPQEDSTVMAACSSDSFKSAMF